VLKTHFSKPIESQPNSPLTFTGDYSFDSVHVRCGNDSASATIENISIAATSQQIGFAAPMKVSLTKTTATTATLSWTGGGTLQEATAITGPWTTSASQSNPQTINLSVATKFYRVSK
jgi:hypothetical protein